MDLGGITLIVTGFPRTGTSTMMRMLNLGGIEALTDSAERDEVSKFSPDGIMELGKFEEKFKEHDISWTANKVVKIVTPYAKFYPIDRPLKAIFMRRDPTEIITSLLAMKTIWGEDIPKSLSYARAKLEYHNVPILYVQTAEMVKYPKATALQIQDFLGVEMDIDGMASAVGDKREKRTYEGDGIIRTDPEPYAKLVLY